MDALVSRVFCPHIQMYKLTLNTRRWPNVGIMLGRRRRRRATSGHYDYRWCNCKLSYLKGSGSSRVRVYQSAPQSHVEASYFSMVNCRRPISFIPRWTCFNNVNPKAHKITMCALPCKAKRQWLIIFQVNSWIKTFVFVNSILNKTT